MQPLLGLGYSFITIHNFPRDRTKEIYKPAAFRLLHQAMAAKRRNFDRD